jgi:hypothetical protein
LNRDAEKSCNPVKNALHLVVVRLFSESDYCHIGASVWFLHNIAALPAHGRRIRFSHMRITTNTFIKSLLGALLLCVFMIRPCAAFIRDVSALKNLAAVEKSVDDSSKEKEESKEGKSRFTPECVIPAAAVPNAAALYTRTPRPLILQEVQGCSGPILLIHTPPPDGYFRN